MTPDEIIKLAESGVAVDAIRTSMRKVVIPSPDGPYDLCICRRCREPAYAPGWRPYRVYLRQQARSRKQRRGWR